VANGGLGTCVSLCGEDGWEANLYKISVAFCGGLLPPESLLRTSGAWTEMDGGVMVEGVNGIRRDPVFILELLVGV
jgi:hypothetical protein